MSPNQLIQTVLSPSMFPREPKLMNQHKNQISSAVRSRRYKKDQISGSKHESPKSLFTRNLLNMYRASAVGANLSNINQQRKSSQQNAQLLSGENLLSMQNSQQNYERLLNNRAQQYQQQQQYSLSNQNQQAQLNQLLNFNYTPQSNQTMNNRHQPSSTNGFNSNNTTQQLDFVSKLAEQQQQQQLQSIGDKSTPISSQSKKGFYIPNANISVVEKNPMNITIYWNGQQPYSQHHHVLQNGTNGLITPSAANGMNLAAKKIDSSINQSLINNNAMYGTSNGGDRHDLQGYKQARINHNNGYNNNVKIN